MRVLIVGLTGTGKTTIANCLGTATSTPVHLLDELVWVGGVLMSYEDQLALGQEIADQDDWIVDGYLG